MGQGGRSRARIIRFCPGYHARIDCCGGGLCGGPGVGGEQIAGRVVFLLIGEEGVGGENNDGDETVDIEEE